MPRPAPVMTAILDSRWGTLTCSLAASSDQHLRRAAQMHASVSVQWNHGPLQSQPPRVSPKREVNMFTRRHLVRSALAGGAALLAGPSLVRVASAFAAAPEMTDLTIF